MDPEELLAELAEPVEEPELAEPLEVPVKPPPVEVDAELEEPLVVLAALLTLGDADDLEPDEVTPITTPTIATITIRATAPMITNMTGDFFGFWGGTGPPPTGWPP